MWQVEKGGPLVVTYLSLSDVARNALLTNGMMITTELSLVLVAQASNRPNVVSQMTAVILATELIAPPAWCRSDDNKSIDTFPRLFCGHSYSELGALSSFSVIHHQTESASTTH